LQVKFQLLQKVLLYEYHKNYIKIGIIKAVKKKTVKRDVIFGTFNLHIIN